MIKNKLLIVIEGAVDRQFLCFMKKKTKESGGFEESIGKG